MMNSFGLLIINLKSVLIRLNVQGCRELKRRGLGSDSTTFLAFFSASS